MSRVRIIPSRHIGVSASLLAVALGAAALLQGHTPASRAEDGGPRLTVERTRTLELPGGRTLTVTAIIDPQLVDPEEAMDELVPGSLPISVAASGASAAFTIFDVWAKPDIPVTMHYSPDNAPAPQGIIYTTGLVEGAIAKWDAIGSGMRVVYGELTSPIASMCDNPDGAGDGINTIQWRSNLRNGVLGSTCTVTNGRLDAGLRVVEADIVFSTKFNWSFGEVTPLDAYDWRSTLLHELGHVIGLGHTTTADAVMLASLARGVQRRTPQDDDIQGVRSLYGPGPAPEAKPVPQIPAPPPGLTKRATLPVVGKGE